MINKKTRKLLLLIGKIWVAVVFILIAIYFLVFNNVLNFFINFDIDGIFQALAIFLRSFIVYSIPDWILIILSKK